MKYFFFFWCLFVAFISAGQGTVSAVPTFNCVGFYWSGSGQTGACKVLYKKQSDSVWSAGFDASFDNRAIGNRPANEYRGSIVNLQPATVYQIQLNAGTSSTTITTSTWSESFPVISTTTLSSPTTISTSGTPTGYKVYTGSINGGTNNIVVNASYIIIRGMTLTGAGEDAILIGAGAHDVIVEGNDISGWGFVGMGSNNQAGVRCKQVTPAPYRMIVQRNKIHDSRDPGSGWDAGGTHALGPNGINFEYPGENNVIRYNSLYQTLAGHKFMDGIGGADNFTTTGFPGANSDVYGNYVDGVYDDGLEIEGGGCNVRVWSNFTNNTFTAISCATDAIGPLYIFRNVSNVGQRLHNSSFAATPSQNDNEDRGPFNKTGSQDATVRGGKVYLFHNTILQPLQAGFKNARGLDGGIVDNGGPVTNVVSKNNIWTSAYTGQGGLPIAMWQGGGQNCSSDHDLLSPNSTQGTFTITNRITGTPTYLSPVPLTLDTNGYYLQSTSPGFGSGIAINNFNNGGSVDVGAYQTGEAKLQFGVNAGSSSGTTPPHPVNQLPVATASVTPPTITLPTNSAMLNGSGTDADGTIIAYSWSKLSGPSSYSLSNANAASTSVSNLVQGTYVFQLTVTDNVGATASASTTIVVNAAIPPPVIKFISYTITTIKAVYSDSTTVTQIIKTQ